MSWRGGVAVGLALITWACEANPGRKVLPAPPPAARQASPAPGALGPSPVAIAKVENPASAPGSPSPSAQPDPPATLSLPLRLGLALPASLVGAAASLRSVGGGDRLAAVGSVLQVGRGGLLVSNHGAGIVGHNGAAIVSNHGGGAVAPAARQLLAGEDLSDFVNDPRLPVWASLLPVDSLDQILAAYAKAQPQANVWVPFSVQADLMPPPNASPVLDAYLQQVLGENNTWHLTGHLRTEGDRLTFWVLRLPREGASPREGTLFFDLQASAGGWRARLQPASELLAFMGAAASAMAVEGRPEGVFIDSGTVMLPWAAQSPLAKAQALVEARVAERRQTLIQGQPGGAADLLIASIELGGRTEKQPNPKAKLFAGIFGFALGAPVDPGLAYSRRFQDLVVGQADPGPFFAEAFDPARAASVPFRWVDPLGARVQAPSEALLRLVPGGSVAWTRLAPPMPQAGEALDRLPELAPAPPPDAILNQP